MVFSLVLSESFTHVTKPPPPVSSSRPSGPPSSASPAPTGSCSTTSSSPSWSSTSSPSSASSYCARSSPTPRARTEPSAILSCPSSTSRWPPVSAPPCSATSRNTPGPASSSSCSAFPSTSTGRERKPLLKLSESLFFSPKTGESFWYILLIYTTGGVLCPGPQSIQSPPKPNYSGTAAFRQCACPRSSALWAIASAFGASARGHYSNRFRTLRRNRSKSCLRGWMRWEETRSSLKVASRTWRPFVSTSSELPSRHKRLHCADQRLLTQSSWAGSSGNSAWGDSCNLFHCCP